MCIRCHPREGTSISNNCVWLYRADTFKQAMFTKTLMVSVDSPTRPAPTGRLPAAPETGVGEAPVADRHASVDAGAGLDAEEPAVPA